MPESVWEKLLEFWVLTLALLFALLLFRPVSNASRYSYRMGVQPEPPKIPSRGSLVFSAITHGRINRYFLGHRAVSSGSFSISCSPEQRRRFRRCGHH